MPTPSPSRDEEQRASLLRRLFGLALQYRGACAAVFALQVVLLVLGLSGLGLSGLAIDVIRHELDPSAPPPRFPFGIEPPPWSPHALLFAIGALVLTMAGARALLNYAYSVQVGKLMHLRLVPELRARVFDKLQRLSFRFFDANASGSIINRVTGDVQSVRAFVDGVLLQGAIMLLSLAVYLVYMLETHVGLSLACLAFMPALWWLTTWFSRRARPEYEKSRALMDELVLAMSEGVHGMQVTKVFGREAEELARFQRKNRAVLEQQTTIFRRVSRFTPSVGFVTHLDTAVLLLYGGHLVSRHVLTLGELIVFAGLMQQFSGQITSMAGIVNTLQQSLAAARRVFEVLDAPIEVAAPPVPRRLGRPLGRVRFEHVSFAYEPGRRVLDDIDFEVPPGTSIGIFGATGAGKSTLLSLVPRFFDASAGRVLVDGHDVRELDLDELRRRVGIVFQESLLFRCSVAENIAFGHPNASREAIERAARIAFAHDFISALPDGYDTILAEGAVNLSGGQRQRIAIARALLLEPSILLLDDPTSAVDAETEHEVLVAMRAAMAGRTTFVVGNRVSTVRHADRILVLDRGRIVESGTHAELMQRRGLYYRTATLQLGEREDERVDSEEGVLA
ncbi:MAG: ABC transporter ATP-binding protein [Pseudomonadota bacterium]